jgi:ribosomal protein S18 acetylase RimI-like enzyme
VNPHIRSIGYGTSIGYLLNIPVMPDFQIRLATINDCNAIALLHARSWQTTYRGILSDQYLDEGLQAERINHWNKKFASLTSKEFVLVAEEHDHLIGFVAVLDKPEKGYAAFIDNLHVSPDLKGKGVGKALMRAVAERLLHTNRKSVYLWVLKGNDAAEKFYFSRGAHNEDVTPVEFGGKTVLQTRFVWSTLDSLLK